MNEGLASGEKIILLLPSGIMDESHKRMLAKEVRKKERRLCDSIYLKFQAEVI